MNNPAIRLAEAGSRTDGLAAAQEAVDLYRELTEVYQDRIEQSEAVLAWLRSLDS